MPEMSEEMDFKKEVTTQKTPTSTFRRRKPATGQRPREYTVVSTPRSDLGDDQNARPKQKMPKGGASDFYKKFRRNRIENKDVEGETFTGIS